MILNEKFEKKINGLKSQFEKIFKVAPTDVFSSPGRIELLGNHTDHNHGKVLVSSINLSILSLTRKRDDGLVIYYAKGYQKIVININDLRKRESECGKSNGLIRGVLYKMKEMGYSIGGVDIISRTSIFKGAGVSSSAAFEILIARIMNYYYNDNQIDAFTLAKIGQFAESKYFDKPCGLLDQSGISLGGVNYIDFESLEEPKIDSLKFFLKDYDIVLTNCLDSHDKLTHLYAKIKDDMHSLANYFSKDYLRQVDEKLYFEKKDELIEKFGEDVYLRGKHYFEENRRVDEAHNAIKNKDVKTFIKCINESGESSFYQLKNCYVGNQEENLPKGILTSKKIIKDGAVRVHGGGFAGTIIAFVNKNESENYVLKMKELFGDYNVRIIKLNPRGTSHVLELKN